MQYLLKVNKLIDELVFIQHIFIPFEIVRYSFIHLNITKQTIFETFFDMIMVNFNNEMLRPEFLIYLFNGSSLSNFPKSQIKIKVENSILFFSFSSLSKSGSFVKIKLVYYNLKVFLTILIQRHH